MWSCRRPLLQARSTVAEADQHQRRRRRRRRSRKRNRTSRVLFHQPSENGRIQVVGNQGLELGLCERRSPRRRRCAEGKAFQGGGKRRGSVAASSPPPAPLLHCAGTRGTRHPVGPDHTREMLNFFQFHALVSLTILPRFRLVTVARGDDGGGIHPMGRGEAVLGAEVAEGGEGKEGRRPGWIRGCSQHPRGGQVSLSMPLCAHLFPLLATPRYDTPCDVCAVNHDCDMSTEWQIRGCRKW